MKKLDFYSIKKFIWQFFISNFFEEFYNKKDLEESVSSLPKEKDLKSFSIKEEIVLSDKRKIRYLLEDGSFEKPIGKFKCFYLTYDDKFQLFIEAEYNKNSKKIFEKIFYPNGNIYSNFFSDNNIYKKYKYYLNGIIREISFYEINKKTVYGFEMDGTIKYKKYYKKIANKYLKNGIFEEYENGVIRKRIHWKEDKITGISQEYYENGVIKEEKDYIDGKEIGVLRIYSIFGDLEKTYIQNEKKIQNCGENLNKELNLIVDVL